MRENFQDVRDINLIDIIISNNHIKKKTIHLSQVNRNDSSVLCDRVIVSIL